MQSVIQKKKKTETDTEKKIKNYQRKKSVIPRAESE